jgi:hypothetical protein
MNFAIAAAFLLGALAWTLVEYLLHRFVGHGQRRRMPSSPWARLTPRGFLGAFNDEHLRHHADARYFAPTSQKVVAALVVGSVFAAVGTLLVGPVLGPAFAVGFSVTYATYEVLHRRIHTHAPRGRYGRWLRRHHLYHHFKTPRLNHGVTSPLWDKVARTELRLDDGEPLRVPQNLAPPWMTDGCGGVWRELAHDYVVAAGARP